MAWGLGEEATREENESVASEAGDLDPRPLPALCLILLFGHIKAFVTKASSIYLGVGTRCRGCIRLESQHLEGWRGIAMSSRAAWVRQQDLVSDGEKEGTWGGGGRVAAK